MTSAELSRVREITNPRLFEVADESGGCVVNYYSDDDSVWCAACLSSNGCEHAIRLRLSGLITHSVKNVRTRKKETNAATAAKE